MKRRWALRIVLGLLALLALLAALAWTPDTDPAAMRAKYGGPAAQYLTIEPGLTVHVRDEGPQDAPPVILLHGLNASLHTWTPVTERLRGRYRFITIDLPGHGLTGPHPRRIYTLASQVAVVRAVAAARGLDRFVLGGNSMGGAVSWTYALTYPEQLAGIVLVNSAGAPREASDGGRPPTGFRIAATPGVRQLMQTMTPRWMIEQSLRQSVVVQESATPAVIDRYWELLRYPGNRAATVDRFVAGREPSRAAELATIRVPALILWGADDPLFPAPVASLFDRAIPDSRLILYPRIGHIPQEEAPDAVASDLSAFIDQVWSE